MNRYDLSYMLHCNMLDNIKRVFGEISIGVKSDIANLTQMAQSMSAEDVENQLTDEYYFYSETFSSINNNIYLANVMSSSEIYLKRLVKVYLRNNPASTARMSGNGSFLTKFENFISLIRCSISFSDPDWLTLDALRAIRNGFIHGEARYSDVEPVGRAYVDNNPSYFCVNTILDRRGRTKKTTFYIKDDAMLMNAIEVVKRITNKITIAFRAYDI